MPDLTSTLLDIARAGMKPLDPRDPDHSRQGIFVHHNCCRCLHGKFPCVEGNSRQCGWPTARND